MKNNAENSSENSSNYTANSSGLGDIDFDRLKIMLLKMPYFERNEWIDYWLGKNQLSFDLLKKEILNFKLLSQPDFFGITGLGVAYENNILEELKHRFALAWVKKNEVKIDELEELFKLEFANNGTNLKTQLARGWIEKNNAGFDDLKRILNFEFVNNFDYNLQEKNVVAGTWVAKNIKNLESLETFFNDFEFENKESRFEIAKYWISVDGRTLDDLKSVFSFFKDPEKSFELIESFAKSDSSITILVENLADVLNSETIGLKIFDVQGIGELISELEVLAEEIPDICNSIYPNSEDLRTELFVKISKDRYFDIAPSFKEEAMKPFIISLHEYKNVLAIIKEFESEEEITNLEILEFFSEKFNPHYESIRDLLESKTIAQSLSEEGLKTINLFLVDDKKNSENSNLSQTNEDQSLEFILGEEFENIFSFEKVYEIENLNQVNIGKIGEKKFADLFFYYDFADKFTDLNPLLKPEIWQEIATKYVPSDKFAYVPSKEYENLKSLLNKEDNSSSSVNFELLSVEVLTDYLKNKITLPEEKIEKFQFAASEVLTVFVDKQLSQKQEESKEEDQKNLKESKEEEPEDKSEAIISAQNTEFRTLLNAKEESLNKDQLASFFENLLGFENPINEENRKKIADFFMGNRDLLAFLFMQKNGLDNFAKTIHALGDGCVANIATQFKISLYLQLTKDDCDQILMSIFSEKISTPILNSGGDFLGMLSKIDIFENKKINENFISPTGFVKALKEEFFKDGKKVRDCWSFFEKTKGKNFGGELLEKLPESNLNLEKKAAEIAAYIVLQNTIDQLLESKYLDKFKENVQEYIQIEAKTNKRKISESGQDESSVPNTKIKRSNSISDLNESITAQPLVRLKSNSNVRNP